MRGTGTTPWSGTSQNSLITTGNQTNDSHTGALILEATTSNNGMKAQLSTVPGAWYGDTQHGAMLIASPGGGKTASTSGRNVLTKSNIARWKEAVVNNGNIGDNKGGLLHLIASSDYHTIKQGVTDSAFSPESFQDRDGANNHSPWGRICLDSDRGIDLVVRTQKYLHEEDFIEAPLSSAIGKTNHSGGQVANDATGIYDIDVGSNSNLAEVRIATDTDLRELAEYSPAADIQPGANINLLYGYGKTYDRHNVSIDDTRYGSPDSATPTAPSWGWRGGRNYVLNGIESKDYGSNILGAGMVEEIPTALADGIRAGAEKKVRKKKPPAAKPSGAPTCSPRCDRCRSRCRSTPRATRSTSRSPAARARGSARWRRLDG